MNTRIREFLPDRERPTILVAAKAPETRRHFRDALNRSKYELLEACRYADIVAFLCRTRPAVIVAETSLGDGTWKDVLGLVAPLYDKPTLVVLDRLADDHLWAEVLSEGAFDLLADPVEPDELNRILCSALRHGSWTAPPPVSAERALAATA